MRYNGLYIKMPSQAFPSRQLDLARNFMTSPDTRKPVPRPLRVLRERERERAAPWFPPHSNLRILLFIWLKELCRDISSYFIDVLITLNQKKPQNNNKSE